MSYVKWHKDAPNVIEEVRCPDCEHVLSRLIRTDTEVDRSVVNGVIRSWNLAVLAATPQYDTYVIQMEDGSKFEVPVCKDCKPHIKTPEDEERLYLAGIEAMEDEDSRVPNSARVKPEMKRLRPKKMADKRKK